MLIHRYRAAGLRRMIRHECKWLKYLPSSYWRNTIRNEIIKLAEEGF